MWFLDLDKRSSTAERSTTAQEPAASRPALVRPTSLSFRMAKTEGLDSLPAWRHADSRSPSITPPSEAAISADVGPAPGADACRHVRLVSCSTAVFAAELSSMDRAPSGIDNLALSGPKQARRLHGVLAATEEQPSDFRHTAFLDDLRLVDDLPDGRIVDEPIRSSLICPAGHATSAIPARTLVFAGENSQGKIVEHDLSAVRGDEEPEGYFTNAVTEIPWSTAPCWITSISRTKALARPSTSRPCRS